MPTPNTNTTIATTAKTSFSIVARKHDWSTAFAVEEEMAEFVVSALNSGNNDEDSPYEWAVISIPIDSSGIDSSLEEMRKL